MVIPKGAIHKVCYILHRGQQFQTYLYQFVFHLLATKMHICTTYLQGREPKVERQPGAHYFPYSIAHSKTRVVGYFCVKLDLMYWPISRWKEKEMRITK